MQGSYALLEVYGGAVTLLNAASTPTTPAAVSKEINSSNNVRKKIFSTNPGATSKTGGLEKKAKITN
jgi:hypothetical protein